MLELWRTLRYITWWEFVGANRKYVGQPRKTGNLHILKGDMQREAKKRSISSWIGLALDIILLILCLIIAANAHAQSNYDSSDVTQGEYKEKIAEINEHLKYDDSRIDSLIGDLSFIRGLGYAVAGLAAGSVGLKIKEGRR